MICEFVYWLRHAQDLQKRPRGDGDGRSAMGENAMQVVRLLSDSRAPDSAVTVRRLRCAREAALLRSVWSAHPELSFPAHGRRRSCTGRRHSGAHRRRLHHHQDMEGQVGVSGLMRLRAAARPACRDAGRWSDPGAWPQFHGAPRTGCWRPSAASVSSAALAGGFERRKRGSNFFSSLHKI